MRRGIWLELPRLISEKVVANIALFSVKAQYRPQGVLKRVGKYSVKLAPDSFAERNQNRFNIHLATMFFLLDCAIAARPYSGWNELDVIWMSNQQTLRV